MQPLIDKFEAEESRKQEERTRREEAEKKALSARRLRRDAIFDKDDPVSCEIRDLLGAIDEHSADDAREKLIELAKLAPEAFTPGIRQCLRDQARDNHHRLAAAAADVVISLPTEVEEKIEVALSVSGHGMSDIVAHCLTQHAASIDRADALKIIEPLAYRAAPIRSFTSTSRPADEVPLLAIAATKPAVVDEALRSLLDGNDPHKVDCAARIILVVTPHHPNLTRPFQRDIIGKLLRHEYLFPGLKRHLFDETIVSLRDAAVALFDADPTSCDEIIQSLCEKGARSSVAEEAGVVYAAVLREEWNGPPVPCTQKHAIAFKRLLWMAVADPTNPIDNRAVHFFSHTRASLVEVASQELDALIGAAASLSQAAEKIETPSAIAVKPTGFEAIQKAQDRASIDRLQGALIEWAFLAVKKGGQEDVGRMIDLYKAIPETELQFRANIVAHLTELITDTSTLNLVLPHLYTALTHPEPIIRGSAATAIGDADHEVRRDFPDLIFEIYIALLTDPFVHVHKSALRALKSHSFPPHLKGNLKLALSNLIIAYSKEANDNGFVVECLKPFVSGFLTESEIEGRPGRAIIRIVEGLGDMHACEAIKDLSYSFRKTDGFARLVGKFLDCDWTQSIGHRDLLQALYMVPAHSLREIVDPLTEAGRRLAKANPFQATKFISVLARAGAYSEAAALCAEIVERLPDTRELRHARAYFEALRQVAAFEADLPSDVRTLEQAEQRWKAHLDLLRQIRDEDDVGRGRPPIFLS